jgi:hypothetical protein
MVVPEADPPRMTAISGFIVLSAAIALSLIYSLMALLTAGLMGAVYGDRVHEVGSKTGESDSISAIFPGLQRDCQIHGILQFLYHGVSISWL